MGVGECKNKSRQISRIIEIIDKVEIKVVAYSKYDLLHRKMEEGRKMYRNILRKQEWVTMWGYAIRQTRKLLNPGLSVMDNGKIGKQFTELKKMV